MIISRRQRVPLGTRSRPKGFTLIEIVIVMGLVAMMAGLALYSMLGGQKEKELLEAYGKVEDAMLQARSLAIIQQIPYTVTLQEGKVNLSPLGKEDDVVTRRLGSGRQLAWDDEGENTEEVKFQRVKKEFSLGEGVELSIKRWGSDDFVLLQGNKKERLIFEPTGLAEPVSLYVQIEDSWIRTKLSPLTARAQSKEMEVR